MTGYAEVRGNPACGVYMTKIAVLTVDETVRIELQRLEQIIQELGEATAAQVIGGAALEQLALALTRTVAAGAAGDLAGVVTHAEQLARLAWRSGWFRWRWRSMSAVAPNDRITQHWQQPRPGCIGSATAR